MTNYLTDDEKQRIRELASRGLTAAQIAKEVGRNRETIRENAKRMGLNLTPGKSGLALMAASRVTGITARAPLGSLAARQREAQMPEITIRLDANAHQILTAAAAHRPKTIERLAADLIEGTCFLGSIDTQEAKAVRYRTISNKEKDSYREIAASADATPAQV